MILLFIVIFLLFEQEINFDSVQKTTVLHVSQ